jgi:glucose-6-phosphate 1-epimerase
MDEPHVRIADGEAHALISLYGATLISHKLGENDPDLFYVSEKYVEGTAIRGGVPICWPQFANAAPGIFPKHGFVRRMSWTLDDEESSGTVAVLRLTHASMIEQVERLPELEQALVRAMPPCDLVARFALEDAGRSISQEVTVHCLPDAHAPVHFTLCFHSYFAANIEPDSDHVYVEGLGPKTTAIDKTNDCSESTPGDRVVIRGQEVDSIYREASGPFTVHPGPNCVRTFTVQKSSNMPEVIVWNIGSEKIGGMKDMKRGDHAKYLCVEPAIALEPDTIAPGEKRTYWHRITVEPRGTQA